MNEQRPEQKKEQPQAAKEIMDVLEVAAYLGIGKSKVYQFIREKKIPASRIGRQYRFSKTVIDAWLKENLITSSDGQLSLDKLLVRNKGGGGPGPK
jgi:excisionase family DNA binding protein